ncbi:MAG TPA: gamma-glutamyltransferase, partial [Gammaproteobacteria bacterium]|nr:gamma-glutamyltransferase [Gammaproteobacteria bacterium]
MQARTTEESWSLSKPAVRGTQGMVASQHYLATEVGLAILKEGGNAIDAAIATGLMLGVVEPWMSGYGGGG